jgi:hypothetical protein
MRPPVGHPAAIGGTRLAIDDDLAGRLLLEQQRGGDQWAILELPAVREEGGTRVALWPGKYPLRRLEETRNAIGPRDWSALYQQLVIELLQAPVRAPVHAFGFGREAIVEPEQQRRKGPSDLMI